ncbi:Ferredoxin--NAD(+) reductase [Crenothrix polyspora]|uniref:Ferredoxin--NAD(+) reductase n=1 Tax=Crenothrix polyspora TaxID=360316 RepID=A0A1R4H7R1_9GAMM|nr:FAD-binding oxidoreductase [Crenothrix polyspora]SJM91890.1 Ferredoxin--NAD(+) reductase [Crenothrix polyspora]
MANITLGEDTLTCQAHETVLDTLLRNNRQIPHSCRQGLCQSCLMRSLDNPPPVSSQVGIKDTLQKQNYFLPCICHPEQDMTIALPHQEMASSTVRVIEKQRLATDIIRLLLTHEDSFNFSAGQFVNLKRADGLTRSYSIANTPHPDKFLEFHIRRLPDGQFSNWVYDDLNPGDTVTISEAQGSCLYLPGRAEQPLLLVGTGTGLAPLVGIIYDALQQNHTGPIHLFHGSRDIDGLYLMNEMRELAATVDNFYYTPCLSGENTAADLITGRAHDVAFAATPTLKGWRVYLCGHPEMVQQTKKKAYLKGASLSDIYADAFHVNLPTGNVVSSHAF